MKNLVNYVILSVAIVIAILAIMSQGVNASGTVLFPSTTNSTNGTLNTAAADNNTGADTNAVPVNNLNTNTQKDSAPANNTTVNIVNKTTNTTPTNSKNLPQTGENDVYIVTVVGVVALAIGVVAFVKSRKYDI